MSSEPVAEPVWPTFVIAGVQKCGTTSLFQALARHPHVVRARKKEMHFFDQNWSRGVDWYLAQFPELAPDQITGESTPAYSYGPRARRRMIRTLPQARIIMVLRDPVARAYSHYWHSRRNQEDLPTFEQAIDAEPARLATGNPLLRRRFSYLERGRYVRHLRPLRKAYGEALLVTTLEALNAAPEAELARVMAHVGLDPAELDEPVMPTVNRYRNLTRSEERRLKETRAAADNGAGRLWRRLLRRERMIRDRERPPMDPDTRERLRKYFEEPDRRLLEWSGWERLPWDSLANPPAPTLQPTPAASLER